MEHLTRFDPVSGEPVLDIEDFNQPWPWGLGSIGDYVVGALRGDVPSFMELLLHNQLFRLDIIAHGAFNREYWPTPLQLEARQLLLIRAEHDVGAYRQVVEADLLYLLPDGFEPPRGAPVVRLVDDLSPDLYVPYVLTPSDSGDEFRAGARDAAPVAIGEGSVSLGDPFVDNSLIGGLTLDETVERCQREYMREHPMLFNPQTGDSIVIGTSPTDSTTGLLGEEHFTPWRPRNPDRLAAERLQLAAERDGIAKDEESTWSDEDFVLVSFFCFVIFHFIFL